MFLGIEEASGASVEGMGLVIFLLIGIVLIAAVRRHQTVVDETAGKARAWYREHLAWLVGIGFSILVFLEPWLSDQLDKATQPVYDPPPVHYEP